MVIAGYVYRGAAIPELQGGLLFADRRLEQGMPAWVVWHDNGSITEVQEVQSHFGGGGALPVISAFGEDSAGELYFTDTQSLGLYKIIPKAAPEDLDGDGVVGTTDLLLLLAAWGTNPGGPPDFDGDGVVATSDFLALLAAWTL